MILLSADSPLGLQTLISSSKGGGNGSGNVATRTIAASPSVVRSLAANGREEPDGGGRDDGKEEEVGGCWVSYGWRRLPRRLPPAIQSPRRALVRERTADGRLVISREEAARRVGARKVVEDRRLVLQLVDDDRDGGGAAPPPTQRRRRRRRSHPLVGQEAKASASAAFGEESAREPTPSSPVAAAVTVPVPPVPAEACFEGAIREASLRETRMSLLRMVH